MDFKQNNNSSELKNEIKEIVDLILSDYDKGRDVDQMDVYNQPDRDAVKDIVIKLIRIISPVITETKYIRATMTATEFLL